MRFQTFQDSASEILDIERSKRNRCGSCIGSCDHVTPEGLVTEEGNNQRGCPVQQSARGSSRTSVVYDGADSTEQPFVWTIVKEEDVLIRLEAFSKLAPAARDESPSPCEFDSL